MRLIQFMGCAVALANHVSAQANSTASCDSVTSICYSSFVNPDTKISYGVALPQDVSAPYDAIISITAPIATTWAGFAWGGAMEFNPLTVVWKNGDTGIASSRFAFGLSLPQAYDGATYDLLKGTTSNSTHWTVTARCQGCTSYQDGSGSTVLLNGTGVVQFGWAQGGEAQVQEPANNNSAFGVHQAVGHWNHDLNAARSPKFNDWVSSNLLPPAPPSTSSASSSSSAAATPPATTLATATKSPNTGSPSIPSSCPSAGSPKFSSVLASGWKATKVLGGLTSPRSIVFDTAGNMIVVQSGKGITVHGIGADGCVTSSKTIVSLNNLNHGLALSVDGKTLYASSPTTVYAWPYTASSTSVGSQSTVLSGMFNGGAHTSRTLLIGAHAPNLLVVSHGSNNNFDYDAGNPKTARAIIKVFDLSAIPSGGYNYVNNGYLAGYGMRNEVGITFDGNNMLWGVENSGDDFRRTVNGQSTDIHQNNPAEKLNYIGDISKANNNWYGYPTCFAVWESSDFSAQSLKVGDHFVVSPNTTYTDATCDGQATAPSLVFQPHSAPIDSKFDSTFENLYVTFHGSWDRQPTTGFKVVVVPFAKGTDGSFKPAAPVTSTTGYTDVFWNPNVENCAGNGPVLSSGCFRPAGLSFDSAGKLYMTSDTPSDGEIWVLGKS